MTGSRGGVLLGFSIGSIAATAAAAMSLAAPQAVVAAGAPSPTLARLQGKFRLAGKVTVARAVPGEHRGENVLRTWRFVPLCPAGACASVLLVRTRANGEDALTLAIRHPGYYVGSGIFYAPLRCGTRIYPKGEVVPFTITVRITAAAAFDGPVIATRVHASYTNRSRRNLTPCVAALGHDAAVYQGQLVGTAAARRTGSPTG